MNFMFFVGSGVTRVKKLGGTASVQRRFPEQGDPPRKKITFVAPALFTGPDL